MHLHVAHLPEATAFYRDVIGLDLVAAIHDSASFLSAGGYHHHVALNTWNGVGAPPPPPDAVGLRYFVVELPDQGEIDRLVLRLERGGARFQTTDQGILVRDPSQNGLLFRVAKTRPSLGRPEHRPEETLSGVDSATFAR
jgi:catechol 2,3-dioxygenase